MDEGAVCLDAADVRNSSLDRYELEEKKKIKVRD